MAVFLGEIVGPRFPDHERTQLREARMDAQLMHDQMLLAWQDWLAAECQSRPVLCVMEDLQWGDRPTVRFVDAALDYLADHPFTVIAIGRTTVHQLFQNLFAGRDVTQIALRPQVRSACLAVARDVLPENVADDVIERLADRSGGNAFYLEEILRSHVARMVTDPTSKRTDELPDSVLALVGARLGGLPAPQRRILRAASVLGRNFWPGGVAELLSEPRSSLTAGIEALVDHELIVCSRRSHYWRGQKQGQAMRWYHRAAEQALKADHLEAALVWADRAVECGARGETLGQLLVLQAEVYNWQGEVHQAGLASQLLERIPEHRRTLELAELWAEEDSATTGATPSGPGSGSR